MHAPSLHASRKTKKTHIGDVPVDWTVTRLEKLANIVRGSSPRPAGSPLYFNGNHLPWITVGDVTGTPGMYLDTTESFLTEEGAKYTRIIEPGTLLLTNSGATLGVPKITRIRAGANDGVAAFLDLNSMDKEFLYYFLESKTRYCREILAPGVGQPNLNTELIGKVMIALPPLAEQRRIAAVLGTWDRAIERQEKLIAENRKLKQSLMQQLFTGKMRFKAFKGQRWRTCHLGEVAHESRLRNDGALTRDLLLAVTKANGMIPMREIVQGVSVERCKIVRTGWFAYNPMRLNIGSIATWAGPQDAMVSGDYVVFRCDEEKLDPSFLNHYRRTHRWAKFVETTGTGSVRVRIWFSDLAIMKLMLPSIEEQRHIAVFLDGCDREIALLEREAAALRDQKKGLMQKLLAGKIRVKA